MAQAFFDVPAARKKGYTDQEIVDHLLQSRDYDVAAATKFGYSLGQIADHLASKPPRPAGPTGPVSTAVGAATNAGLNAVETLGTVGEFLSGGRAIRSMTNQAIEAAGGEKQPASIGEAVHPTLRNFFNNIYEPILGERPVYEDVKDIPADQRPLAIGTETATGSLAPGLGVVGLAKAGVRPAGKFLKDVFERAATSPKAFMAAEGSLAAGAGIGGATAEIIAPGDPYARFAGEVVGGAGTLPRIAATQGALGAFRRFRQAISSDARESEAGKLIRDAITASGGHPETVVQNLERNAASGMRGTAGMLSQNPGAIALEKLAAKESPEFGPEFAKAEGELFANLRSSIDMLYRDGSPAALKAAGELRTTLFNRAINGIVARTREAAKAEGEALARGGPDAIPQAQAAAVEVLEKAQSKARAVERTMWRSTGVKSATPIPLKAAKAAYREVGLAEATTGQLVQGKIKAATADELSFREMLQLRSQFLSRARTAVSQGDAGKARAYGKMAKAVLSDIEAAVPGEGVQNATAFSRAMHERFDETIAGDLLARTERGNLKNYPERGLERATKSDWPVPEKRLTELTQAAEFPAAGSAKRGLDMELAQERWLRGQAAELVDKETGLLDPEKLTKFQGEYRRVLSKFPGLSEELAQAETAAASAARAGDRATDAEKLAVKSIAGKLVASEKPYEVVDSVLQSSTPMQGYRNLAITAKRAGPQAVMSLQRGTIESAFSRVTKEGKTDFVKLEQELFNEPSPGVLPVVDIMRRNGITTQAEAARLRRLVQEGATSQKALEAKVGMQEPFEKVDSVWGLITTPFTIAGAAAGSAFHRLIGGGGPGSIIAAGKGSQTAKNALSYVSEKFPNLELRRLVISAAKDPKLFAALVRKARTEPEQIKILRQINGYLAEASQNLYEGPPMPTQGQPQEQ